LEDECPAGRKENAIKLQTTNARKDCERIDIRKKVNR
jgi:hypothetical protein